jgi:hypothetical protein
MPVSNIFQISGAEDFTFRIELEIDLSTPIDDYIRSSYSDREEEIFFLITKPGCSVINEDVFEGLVDFHQETRNRDQFLQDVRAIHWVVRSEFSKYSSRSVRLASPIYKYGDLKNALEDISDACLRIAEAFPLEGGVFNLKLKGPGLQVFVGPGKEMRAEHKVKLLSILALYERALDTIHRDVGGKTPLIQMENYPHTRNGLRFGSVQNYLDWIKENKDRRVFFENFESQKDPPRSYVLPTPAGDKPDHYAPMFEFNEHEATLDQVETRQWVQLCLTIFLWADKSSDEEWANMISGYFMPRACKAPVRAESRQENETDQPNNNHDPSHAETAHYAEALDNFLCRLGYNVSESSYFVKETDTDCSGRFVHRYDGTRQPDFLTKPRKGYQPVNVREW